MQEDIEAYFDEMRFENMILIPKPKQMHQNPGTFVLGSDTKIFLDAQCNSVNLEAALLLKAEILQITSLNIEISKTLHQNNVNSILIKKVPAKEQSYKIQISTDNVELIGADDAGVLYAVQTFRQILRSCNYEIPCLEIIDEPSYKVRGFYHDVTRGKVPKLKTLFELVDTLSFYKINQLQLYVEHSFAFSNLQEIWSGNDPITAEEILLLDDYCLKRGIELVPSLSTFGHLYHLLQSDSYRHLCELEVEDCTFTWPDRMKHHTLNVSKDGSFEIVKEMLNEYVPLFSSGKFNICCDETFDLGNGKNKSLAEQVGKGRLYIDFVKKIIAHVKSHGKQVMFWGDIVLKHPEYISELPEDIICLNWGYDATVTEEQVKAFYDAGKIQYVCPGVNQWSSLAGSHDTAFVNIAKLIDFGVKYSAVGVLNTDWGDYGHINFLSASIPGMIFGAALSWNNNNWGENLSNELESGNDKLYHQIDSDISKLEFKDKTGTLFGLIRELSRCSLKNWRHIVDWLYEKENIIYGHNLADDTVREQDENELRSCYEKALEIQESILKLLSASYKMKALDYQEFALSANGVALFQALGIVMNNEKDTAELILTPKELARKLEDWNIKFISLWRARNKESELYRINDTFRMICKILREY